MAAKGSTGLRPRIRKAAISATAARKQQKKSKPTHKRAARAPRSSKRFSMIPHHVAPTLPVRSATILDATAVIPVSSIAPKNKGTSNIIVGKTAQLSKSKSKAVQIPAFGFIDVCFCVDSTGSMAGELAQVQ